MITFGICVAYFSMGLKSPARWPLFIAALASFGVAGFPCSEGCPGPETVTDIGHAIAAGTFYAALSLAPVLHERTPLTTIVSTAAALALITHVTGLGPNGLLQRVGLTIGDAWIIATAISMAKEHSDAPVSSNKR